MSEWHGVEREVFEYLREIAPRAAGADDLARTLGIGWGTAHYTLDRLEKMGLIEARREYGVYGFLKDVVWFYPRNFVHYTVVGNVKTGEEEGNLLTASCTLDYDVIRSREEDYYKKAVILIGNWISDMFNYKDAKYSSEVSATMKEVADEMIAAGAEVTSIAYFWIWLRAGRTRNGEQKDGEMEWDEAIPVGEAGGWFTTGRPRREKGGE